MARSPSSAYAGSRAAARATVTGRVQGVGFREAAVRRARELAVTGWVRNAGDGTVSVHAEGTPPSLAEFVRFLGEGPRGAAVSGVELEPARVEGHEQFAVRGVAAGVFVVREHAASSRHFDLRIELDGAMRSWALPRGPSLDPAVRRLAVEVPEHPREADPADGGSSIVWDRGSYEQGGRVPWPEALERGHAVFVLHGDKLRGGFALQRTSPPQAEPRQWLLIKRRDEHARGGYDVVAERPASVLSGRTLDELLADARR